MEFTSLLAQATSVENGLFSGMLGAAGSVGFAIFYGVYMTTVTLPKMLQAFREETASIRDANEKQLDLFRAELREEREARSKDSSRIADAIETLWKQASLGNKN